MWKRTATVEIVILSDGDPEAVDRLNLEATLEESLPEAWFDPHDGDDLWFGRITTIDRGNTVETARRCLNVRCKTMVPYPGPPDNVGFCVDCHWMNQLAGALEERLGGGYILVYTGDGAGIAGAASNTTEFLITRVGPMMHFKVDVDDDRNGLFTVRLYGGIDVFDVETAADLLVPPLRQLGGVW